VQNTCALIYAYQEIHSATGDSIKPLHRRLPVTSFQKSVLGGKRFSAMAHIRECSGGDDELRAVCAQRLATLRHYTMSFEYRRFPNKLSVAADLCHRGLATRRETGELSGVSAMAVQRAIAAIRAGRPCGVNGHPRWLSDKAEAELQEKLLDLCARKQRLSLRSIQEHVRGVQPVLHLFPCFLTLLFHRHSRHELRCRFRHLASQIFSSHVIGCTVC